MKELITASTPANQIMLGGMKYAAIAMMHLRGIIGAYKIGSVGVLDTHFDDRTKSMVYDHTMDELCQIIDKAQVTNLNGDKLFVLIEDEKQEGNLLGKMGLKVSSTSKSSWKDFLLASITELRESQFSLGVTEVRTRALSENMGAKLLETMVSTETMVDIVTQPSDPMGGKVLKRLKKLFAPTVANAFGERSLRAVVLPCSPTTDGMSFISSNLHREMVDGYTAYGHSDRAVAQAKHKLGKSKTFNGAVIGSIVEIDYMTGQEVGTLPMVKGQFRVVNLPEGIDLVVPGDNLKKELMFDPDSSVEPWYCVALNPQGPKKARLDAQALMMIKHLISVSSLRSLEEENLRLDYHYLTTGGSTIDSEESMDVFADVTFSQRARFTAEDWQMRGLSLRYSPFLTRQVGNASLATRNFQKSWIKFGSGNTLIERMERLHAQTKGRTKAQREEIEKLEKWFKSLNVPVPHGARIQHVSADIANIAMSTDGGKINLSDVIEEIKSTGHVNMALPGRINPHHGKPIYIPKLGMVVYSNADYENKIMPTHGGSDADDFYMFFPVEDDIVGKNYFMTYRNPIGFGEWSTWELANPQEWMRDYGTRDEEDNFLPPLRITEASRAPEILDAINAGETQHLQLPSELSDWATAVDDREFLTEYSDGLMRRILESDEGIDRALAHRVNADECIELTGLEMKTHDGLLTKVKAAQSEILAEYGQKVEDLANDPIIPDWLHTVGNNNTLHAAGMFLQRMRSVGASAAMEYRDINPNAATSAVHAYSREAVERLFLGYTAGSVSESNREKFIVALWYSMLTKPQKNGMLNDSAFFVSDVMYEALVAALEFFGVTPRLVTNEDGTVTVVDGFEDVDLADITWTLECSSCNDVFFTDNIDTVVRYRTSGAVCKQCRG